MLTVALALSTAFPVFDDAITTLQLFLFENFLPDAEGLATISEQIMSFSEQAGRLTAIGLIFLLLTAVMLMLTIDDALNHIFRVRRRRPLAQQIIMYWSVLTLWPVLIGASLSLTSYLVGNTSALLRLIPFVFTWAALTVLYLLVPYRHVDVHHAAAGALLAGIAFEAAKRAFALYLSNFPTYTLIYGAFATLPIFLVWMYVSWLVVLAGAIFTAMLPGYSVITSERSDRRRELLRRSTSRRARARPGRGYVLRDAHRRAGGRHGLPLRLLLGAAPSWLGGENREEAGFSRGTPIPSASPTSIAPSCSIRR